MNTWAHAGAFGGIETWTAKVQGHRLTLMGGHYSGRWGADVAGETSPEIFADDPDGAKSKAAEWASEVIDAKSVGTR